VHVRGGPAISLLRATPRRLMGPERPPMTRRPGHQTVCRRSDDARLR
jgi:hypothetical protein